MLTLEEITFTINQAAQTSGKVQSYETFGGPIEHLAGFKIQDSVIVEESRFDSVSDSMDDELLVLFIEKMSGYGIPPEVNGFFFPIKWGFWGE